MCQLRTGVFQRLPLDLLGLRELLRGTAAALPAHMNRAPGQDT